MWSDTYCFMKPFGLSLALVLGSAGPALAQAGHAIKLNPVSAGLGTGSLFYEHRLAERRSAQLGGAFTRILDGDRRFTGLTITPEYRFYLAGRAPGGFYLGPFARFRSFRMTSPVVRFDEDGRPYKELRTGRTRTYGAGAVAGWQWVFFRHLSLDVYAGPSYSFGTFTTSDGSSADEFDDFNNLKGIGIRFSQMFRGAGLRSGFTLGFAW